MGTGKRSFIKGAAILGVAGLLVKVIGALYRIPLTAIISPHGMGLYMIAYPIYAYLLVLSTAGLPTAISKMVAERQSRGDEAGAYDVFRASRRVLLWIGLVSSVALFALAGPVAGWIQNPEAALGMRAIAPALLFVAWMSAYRGYFQGRQDMMPTALSQIVEQLGKLALGLMLAGAWIGLGYAQGAAGALLGVALSEIMALALLMGMARSRVRRIARPAGARDRMDPARRKRILRQLAAVAVPVTLGASIMPMVGLVDSALVVSRLHALGLSTDVATTQFGLLTGVVNTLTNMPAVLTLALQMSLVPAITQAMALRQMHAVRTRSRAGVKLSYLIGLPAAAGLLLLAQPIIALLYRTLAPDELALSARLLAMMAPGVLFLSVVQGTTGILQGIGRVMVPVRNMAVGAVLKVALNALLIGMPGVGILGAAIATVVCYGVAALLNLVSVYRALGMRVQWKKGVLMPLFATAAMGVAVYVVCTFAKVWIASDTAVTLLAVAVGAGIYGLFLLLTGAVDAHDLSMLPHGDKIARALFKCKIFR
nr:polysaccharide biosynthesis protein [Maliibacterium massiliense]